MKKLIIAAMLLALVPATTASAGLFDFLKKKPAATAQERRDAAKKRFSATKARFQKKMAERRKKSGLAERFERKEKFRARSKRAQDFVKQRSAMYPAAPNR